MLERWIAGLGGALLVAVAPASAQLDQRALLSRIDTDRFGLPAPASLGDPLRLVGDLVPRADRRRDSRRLPAAQVAGRPISPRVPGRDWCLGALQA